MRAPPSQSVAGRLAPGHEDTQGEAPEGPSIPQRLGSASPAPAARRATRCAQQEDPRTQPVLRRQRQRTQSPQGRVPGPPALVPVAATSQPTRIPTELEAVHRISRCAPASATPDRRSDLGLVSVRLLDGRAEWWKSPRSVPRGPGRATARATRLIRCRYSLFLLCSTYNCPSGPLSFWSLPPMRPCVRSGTVWETLF